MSHIKDISSYLAEMANKDASDIVIEAHNQMRDHAKEREDYQIRRRYHKQDYQQEINDQQVATHRNQVTYVAANTFKGILQSVEAVSGPTPMGMFAKALAHAVDSMNHVLEENKKGTQQHLGHSYQIIGSGVSEGHQDIQEDRRLIEQSSHKIDQHMQQLHTLAQSLIQSST